MASSRRSGTQAHFALRAAPVCVRAISTTRSSVPLRVRRMYPSCWSRFSSGVKVFEFSNARAPMWETEQGASSHKIIITMYCGYVKPNGSSRGWYSRVIRRDAAYNGKHSCRSSRTMSAVGILLWLGILHSEGGAYGTLDLLRTLQRSKSSDRRSVPADQKFCKVPFYGVPEDAR